MTSNTLRGTREKKLAWYLDGTRTNFRIARSMLEHAPSKEVRDHVEHVMLPEAYIRNFTYAAKTRDRASFDKMLKDPETIGALFRRPEVFLKAMALLLFPGLFYRLRSR